MNYTLQLHGERMVYPVPPGLYELMSDISREVLRDQPTALYKYIADYLETVLKVRDSSREAGELVSDVLSETKELLAFVDSLGLSWEEAKTAARKIQEAFRKYKCRKDLKLKIKAKEEKERTRTLSLGSPSFQNYIENLGVDIDDARKASTSIQAAYRSFVTRKQLKEDRTDDITLSTHTVDTVLPMPVKTKRKPRKRDSKLLVYQQSPRHSAESTWSTLARRLEQNETKTLDDPKNTSSTRSSSLLAREGRFELPTYYNNTKPKVPMISESGQLIEEMANDVVTLLSAHSVAYGQSESVLKLSALSELTDTKPELAKELFNIIDQSANKLRIIKSEDNLIEGVKKKVTEVISQNLPNAPAPP